MATRLQQSVLGRMHEIQSLVRSGATEMTGKTYRGADGRIAGRFGGGMSIMYPELARAGMSPGQAAAAVERGRGRVYERLRLATEMELEPYFPEPRRRSPGRPSVPAHARLTAKCRHCLGAHTTGQHRFHGQGAYHQTHLFSFNPPGQVQIYPPSKGVVIQGMKKGPGHPCSTHCKAAGHRYRHKFKNVEIIGLPDGSVLLRSKRR